jgi:hypothetical protein
MNTVRHFVTASGLISLLATARVASANTTATAPQWVHVPGALMRQDCVHQVPNGAHITEAGDVSLNGALIAHYDACPVQPIFTGPGVTPPSGIDIAPEAGGGWVEDIHEYLNLQSGDNIDYLHSNWGVPFIPPNAEEATIYIWNGIQSSQCAFGGNAYCAIMQPVLQFGQSCGNIEAGQGGGVQCLGGWSSWNIASWLVTNQSNTGYFSPPLNVNQYDEIEGVLSITGSSGGYNDWAVEAADLTIGGSTTLYFDASTGIQWSQAFAGTLEAWNVPNSSSKSSCEFFPNNTGVLFYNTEVYHGFPQYEDVSGNWTGEVDANGPYDFGVQYSGYNCAFGYSVGSNNNGQGTNALDWNVGG